MDAYKEISKVLNKLNKSSQKINDELEALIKKLDNGNKTRYKGIMPNNNKEILDAENMKTELSNPAVDVLKKCSISENTVRLPEGQLDRKLYLEVKQRLELIGGKWKGGKIAGFVFQEDPAELLQQISNGEKRNLKKEHQFFATPDVLADKLVEIAEITDKHLILEPSAGQGAIIKAIDRKLVVHKKILWCETMPTNRIFLNKINGAEMWFEDFLEAKTKEVFDRIIANPPFSKNQDILHIRKMYDCLKVGGRMVSMASKHWQASKNKKETEFREWLKEVGAYLEEVDAGVFKESGTNISTIIISIDKK